MRRARPYSSPTPHKCDCDSFCKVLRLSARVRHVERTTLPDQRSSSVANLCAEFTAAMPLTRGPRQPSEGSSRPQRLTKTLTTLVQQSASSAGLDVTTPRSRGCPHFKLVQGLRIARCVYCSIYRFRAEVRRGTRRDLIKNDRGSLEGNLSPFDLILEILDNCKPEYTGYRVELYKDGNRELPRIIDSVYVG
jgi:hypothetical protein